MLLLVLLVVALPVIIWAPTLPDQIASLSERLRAALAHADAVAVLAAERGRQFDPDVTDAFVDVCDAWPAIRQRHA
jgi:hypothetical protein